MERERRKCKRVFEAVFVVFEAVFVGVCCVS